MKRCDLLRTVSRWVLVALCAAFLSAPPASAEDDGALINKDADNVAIEGYDTVAYFTEAQAVKGKSEFELIWQDARWRFFNSTHRDLFAAKPERYAPQFGGHCAGAMTRGVVVRADPEAWTIVDGKLYLKVTKQDRDQWRKNVAENIKKANGAWAEMTEENENYR